MVEETAADVWERLWHLAQAVCDEIEANRPQLIVVLHCSGTVVWRAVERLWRATRREPLPPTIGARINQACADSYWDQYEPNEWEYMGDDGAGHMVAWAAGQGHWVAAMQARMAAALGATPPDDVLIVDDVVHDGWTALTAFGVLLGAAPDARLRLLAGLPGNWRELLGQEWLEREHPAIAGSMVSAWPNDKAELFPHHSFIEPSFFWRSLVSGLTAGSEDALASAPLGGELPSGGLTARYLTRYLPAEEWLEFSKSVAAMLDARMDGWIDGSVAPPPLDPNPYHQPRRYGLRPEELLWAHSFRQRWSTVDEYARFCHLPPAEMADRLAALAAEGEFTTCTVEGVTHYGRAHKAGILVWEPRLAGLPEDTAEYVEKQVAVVTPFAVEFAGAAGWCAGAPQLVPIPDGWGTPVAARVLVLDFRRDRRDAHDTVQHFLKGGGPSLTSAAAYASPAAHAACKLAEETFQKQAHYHVLEEFAGVRHVVYWSLDADLQDILAGDGSRQQKGRLLAERAIASLTAETYPAGTDGIQYLIDCLAWGITTPLTPYYQDALLHLAGDAPDLEAARRHVAHEKGVTG